MRLAVAAVGRSRAGPERALFEHYAGRIAGPFELTEVAEKRRLAGPARRRSEAKLLLARAPRGAIVVALDAKGKALTSAQLARKLGAWRDGGVRDVVFMIGGPDGLADSVLERADLVLSLGAMTWPHLLVRGMLAEQVYRAESILSGHPYHRA